MSSDLLAPPREVSDHALSMDGVNRELGPWVRMTHPSGEGRLRPGRTGHLFDSWLLALGLLPFDRHRLTILEVEVADSGGMQFVEESTSWLQKRWRHERSVEPTAGGSRVTDRVVAEPRVRFTEPLVSRFVASLFRHRHRRLGACFGVPDNHDSEGMT